MRILVFSDTHGKIKEAKEIIKKHSSSIDMVIHLGDYLKDGAALSKEADLPCECVGGNMDEPLLPEDLYRTIETPYGKALLTHGHMDSVKSNSMSLLYRAQEVGAKIAFFGHTHSHFFEEVDGIYLINPGSLTRPRLSTKGTYLVIDISKERVIQTVHYIDESKTLGSGFRGSLFDVLNNSDRF